MTLREKSDVRDAEALRRALSDSLELASGGDESLADKSLVELVGAAFELCNVDKPNRLGRFLRRQR
jgi:hypothetical protein